MAIKTLYRPVNPHKYKGDPTKIVARSSWERFVMRYCDFSSSVVSWSSEENIIPYKCGTDGRLHRYFPDFVMELKDKSVLVIEVKPWHETQKPKINSKRPGIAQKRRFMTEALKYTKNVSKWAAAESYCKAKGWKFCIWTENELKRMGMSVD